MKQSKMSKSVAPSLIRRLFDMAHEIGDDVVDLTLGDPDVLPPKEVREAACEAIMAGKTRYSANPGIAAVRASYAAFFSRQYGFTIDPDKNIMSTVGGMEALFMSLAAIVDSGDEVILLGPYYANYYQMICMCGGLPVVVDRLGKDTEILLGDLKAAITEKTIGIIINTPCNPVGDVLPSGMLDGIAEIAREHDLIVISDEVYNSLVYDGRKAESIISRDGMKERTIIVDSCSKRFAMTGWRMGFAVGPESVIHNMITMQENVVACAPLPSQHAAVKAYTEDFDYSYIHDTYEHRRDLVYDSLKKITNLKCVRPSATFYCFIDVSKTGMDSETFAYALLEKAHVAVVPGIAYGDAYADYIRIAFTQSDELLDKAMQRLTRFCKGLQ